MTVSLAAAWSTFDALRDASVDSNVRFAAALVVVAPLVAEANGCISLVLSFLIAIRYPTGEPRLRRAVIYAGAAAVLVGVVTFLLVAAAARAAWEANPVH